MLNVRIGTLQEACKEGQQLWCSLTRVDFGQRSFFLHCFILAGYYINKWDKSWRLDFINYFDILLNSFFDNI